MIDLPDYLHEAAQAFLEAPIRATFKTVSKRVETFTTQENWMFFSELAFVLGWDRRRLGDRIAFPEGSVGKDCSELVTETLYLMHGWKLSKVLQLMDAYAVDPVSGAPCCFIPSLPFNVKIPDLPVEWWWGTEPDWEPRLNYILDSGGFAIKAYAKAASPAPDAELYETVFANIDRLRQELKCFPRQLWLVYFPEPDYFYIGEIQRVSLLICLLVSAVVAGATGEKLQQLKTPVTNVHSSSNEVLLCIARADLLLDDTIDLSVLSES